jgi:hypothetical protein
MTLTDPVSVAANIAVAKPHVITEPACRPAYLGREALGHLLFRVLVLAYRLQGLIKPNIKMSRPL